MDSVRLVETLDPDLYQVHLGGDIIGHVIKRPELAIHMEKEYGQHLPEIVKTIKSMVVELGIQLGPEKNYFLPRRVTVYRERCNNEDVCMPGTFLSLL